MNKFLEVSLMTLWLQLARVLPKKMQQRVGYSLNFQNSKSSIGLIITATQIEDSTVYFCAIREGTVAEESIRGP
ncbi:T cell receptor alpha variable 14/delta variable 4 [Lemmus lemmus]